MEGVEAEVIKRALNTMWKGPMLSVGEWHGQILSCGQIGQQPWERIRIGDGQPNGRPDSVVTMIEPKPELVCMVEMMGQSQ